MFGTRVAFRLDPRNGPEPDIAFVRKKRLHFVERGFVRGGPDLAVEIVSPDSVERDYDKKRKQYERAGVPEYWIVDEIEQKVTLLRLGKDGKYKEVRPRKGILHSKALPGFWLRVEWLWQSPLPKTVAVLREYRAVADELGVEKIAATATSASRDASNRDDFFGEAERVLGVRPQLLSGDDEARLEFLGATAGLPEPGP